MIEILNPAAKTQVSVSDTRPKNIGLILASNKLKLPSLKYFLLSMNKVQPYFEYDLLPDPDNNDLIGQLQGNDAAERREVASRVENWSRAEFLPGS